MDARDYEAEFGQKFIVNVQTMTVKVTIYYSTDENDIEEQVDFPFRFVVCGLCDGRGKHVNPSSDSNGISPEEFDEDPEFRESYFSGVYDETCYRCGGKNVEPEIDEEAIENSGNEELKLNYKRYLKNLEDRAETAREIEYERRMGF